MVLYKFKSTAMPTNGKVTNALCLLVVCIGKCGGSGVGNAECGVHVDVHVGSELCCGWLQCSCYTEHGRYGLCWMQKLWSAWAGSVWYVGVSYVEFYCWTWQIWIVFYVESCGVSSAEYSVHLVSGNRLESFVVCIVDKMAQYVEIVWNCCGIIPI